MKLTRRTLVLGGIAAPLATQVAAQAQTWPSGTVRIVVAYPPGGSTDAMMRLVQPGLQQRLGTTIIIENRSGASGSVGTGAVAKSPPDGNTWLAVFDNHAANPFVLPSLPYDTEKDLDPVLLIGTAPYLITTAKAKPYNTLADVIAAAKAKPGTVSYASVGSGSVGHLAMALLSQRAGVKLTHVPYRGGGPAMNDAVAGHVDLLVGSTALSMPQVDAGNHSRGRADRENAQSSSSPRCRPWPRAAFPISKPMPGGASSRRPARRSRSSSASAMRWPHDLARGAHRQAIDRNPAGVADARRPGGRARRSSPIRCRSGAKW